MDNTDPYKTKFKEERLYMSTNQNLMQHMRELIDRIKAADVAYYRDDNPTMTDREYDLLVDELKELETTTGLILSGSPTQTVSGEILKELTPVRHTKPMLSADKTKSVDEMLRFANGRPVVLSWKLDGLTLVLRYEGGEFKQAITRGREGIIGEDVTHTVRTFMNVPMCIPCTDKFEVRGEGVISWAHFEKINLSLSEPYSHPRNLAAGSVRMLDARESGKRYLEFFAFDLISDSIEEQSKTAQLQFLAENGFDVVPYVYTDTHDADELRKLIADFKPAEYGYPVDGVIMEYDNLVYGRSLGATGHHENRLMALKWEDELYETECTGLDVAVTRTGMVSLTATFKPVEIDGTMVSRAYVHNFTIYKNLALGVGDKLMVYKANKIIPQIAENRTKSGELDYPHTCPCCGSRLTFHNRCRIHTVNPRACRIYPLVVDPKENGRYEYLVSYERKQHFKGPKVHVKTWMKKRFGEEDRAFLTADFGSAKELAQLLRQIPDKRKKRALMCFHWAKYGNFDTGKPFLPQYERNLKVLREYSFQRGLPRYKRAV